ncbi:hypothetical protein D9X91_08435 [Falsibacillus albus]|uniref:Uncharacterized protein n=1 Tax=Falsibacillus albus TaxID=2478915 RepID=A0A3L7K2T8_9BACI|nr:hypothetical protein D9X91_08435 [Falsibacillus albus]
MVCLYENTTKKLVYVWIYQTTSNAKVCFFLFAKWIPSGDWDAILLFQPVSVESLPIGLILSTMVIMTFQIFQQFFKPFQKVPETNPNNQFQPFLTTAFHMANDDVYQTNDVMNKAFDQLQYFT